MDMGIEISAAFAEGVLTDYIKILNAYVLRPSENMTLNKTYL